AEDLMTQAKGPIEAAVEMNARPEEVVATLASISGYVDGFKAAFPGEADPVTYDNVARAIEAFEVTLVTPDAPFDQYLRGDGQALDEAARRGLAAFMDKGCLPSHSSVDLGGAAYFAFCLLSGPGPELFPAGAKERFQVPQYTIHEPH